MALGLAAFAGIVVLAMISTYLNPAPKGQDSFADEARTAVLEPVPGLPATQRYQVTAAPDEALFIDDFGSNVNGWDWNSVQSRWLDWSFTGGKLRVARTAAVVPFAGLMRFCLPVPKGAFADFQFSLDARSESRTAGMEYGICVDRPSGETRYYFALDSDGMVSAFVEEKTPAPYSESIQEPTALSIVNIDDTNQITVSAVDSTLTFYVNRVEAIRVPDAPLGPGSIGLFVEVVPGSGDETWVEFSSLIVRKP